MEKCIQMRVHVRFAASTISSTSEEYQKGFIRIFSIYTAYHIYQFKLIESIQEK
jgi:hypothetical protein